MSGGCVIRGKSQWTEERVEELRRLWATDGVSCRAMARELGVGVGAITGKASRLGLPRKATGAKIKVGHSEAPRPRRPRQFRKVRKNPSEVVVSARVPRIKPGRLCWLMGLHD